jgi:hypothetical protein
MLTLLAGALGAIGLLGSAGFAVIRRRRRRAHALYQATLERALADGILTPEEMRELQSLREAKALSDAEVRMAGLAIYRRALRDAAADVRVTREEDAHLSRLQEQLGLSEADLAGDRRQVQRLRFLAQIERGEFPTIDAPFELAPEETCVWVVRATLAERLALPSGQGHRPPVSLPFVLAGDQPFEVVGDRNALASNPEVLPIDLGILAVTDRRVVFQGAKRRLTLPHVQLTGFGLYTDALRLDFGDGAPPRFFLVEDAELTAAVLHRSARERRRRIAAR